MAGGREPEEVAIRLVSASYFATLGVPAAVGQTFDAREEPAEGAAPYAVISHEYWQRRFGGRPDVLGRTIALRGGVLSIIGVTPPRSSARRSASGPTPGFRWRCRRSCCRGATGCTIGPAASRRSCGCTCSAACAQVCRSSARRRMPTSSSSRGSPPTTGPWLTRRRVGRFLDQRLRLKPAATGASALRGSFAEPLVGAARRRRAGAAHRVLESRQPAAGAHHGAAAARWRCDWRSARAAAAWFGSC